MARKRAKAGREDIEFFRTRRRYDLLERLVSPLSPLGLVALYIPIRGSVPIAEALSGEETSLNVKVSVGIVVTYSLCISLGALMLFVKNRAQSSELRRLRDRLGEDVP